MVWPINWEKFVRWRVYSRGQAASSQLAKPRLRLETGADSSVRATRSKLLELLSEAGELLFQLGEFFFEDGDFILQVRDSAGISRACKDGRGRGCPRQAHLCHINILDIAREQVPVAGLFGSGLSGENSD